MMNDKKLKALQLISTPMRYNGQTLFPMRMSQRMRHVQADFLTCFVGDERLFADAEAMNSRIFIAPSRMKHPLGYIRFVSNLVKKEKYDVVHCHGNSCTLAIDLLAARLGGAKVRIAHSHNSQCRFALAHRLLRPLFNRTYTHAMACGEEAGRWLFGQKPFTISRNAIDTRAFAYDPQLRETLRAEFACGERTVIGCVGTLSEIKNHKFLLNAFAKALQRNPDYLLMIVGDGPLRESLEAQAESLGISESVRFLGLRTDVARLLSMMDVMALPSLFEGFPTVALEWQCSGLPALLADNITPDCAFVPDVQFLPPDEAAWSDAILTTAQGDRASASRAGIAALTQAGYDLSAAAEEMEMNYMQFIQS